MTSSESPCYRPAFGVPRIYLFPELKRLDPRSAIVPILLLHALRNLGLMFLAPGVIDSEIPAEFT